MTDGPVAASATSTTNDRAPPIALRWEWRTFGHRFGAAEDRISSLPASQPNESDEIYFLSDQGENVKVRDGLMDIKVLRMVNPDGLEQWAPAMKAQFPLSPADAAKVAEALRLQLPGGAQESYDLETILEAVARPGSKIRAVTVHKRRVRYTVAGCMAELSDIVANGLPVRTIAVESTDPVAVMTAVDWLGLGGYANVSYPRALAQLLAGEPERYAVIDVGTNSVKFHIAARRPDGSWATIADRAAVTRLGEGLAGSGQIGASALERTAEAISGMVDEAKQAGVRATAAVGTAGLRIAANADEVIAAIRERTGVGIEVLSGEDEARLAYQATIAELPPAAGSVVVFDTGGGSSQFTFGHEGAIDERFSINVGAVRYTDRFGLDRSVPSDRLDDVAAAISSDLVSLEGRPEPNVLVGMGGALTNLTAVALGLDPYDPERVQGATLTREEILRQIELYRSLDAEGRRSIVGLQPNRAEVILAGACIVRGVMQKLAKDHLIVSDRGLRHGVLAERFGN